jgi:hypothetical protein
VRYLWDTAFKNLLELPAAIKAIFVKVSTQAEANAIKESISNLEGFSKAAVWISFAGGVIYGIVKRQWKYLALLLFFIIYVGTHMIRHKTLNRYCVPMVWLAVILCAYGFVSIWKTVNFRKWMPRAAVISLQIAVFIGATIWLVRLMPYLPQMKPHCTKAAYLPYVAMAAVIAILILRLAFFRARYIWRDLALSSMVCLMIVSSHFMTARIIGNGSYDYEFKMLADWYLENAKPGEKMLTTMPGVVSIFAPKHKASFRHTNSIKTEDINEFTKKCWKSQITYIAWDSRLGYATRDSYYKKWQLRKIAPLIKPADIGPYEFVTQLKSTEKRFINVFRLRTSSEYPASKPER